MSYLLVYDIKRLDNATRLRVNRRLRKLGALKIQHSMWEFTDFFELKNLAELIISTGGKGIVLRKEIVVE